MGSRRRNLFILVLVAALLVGSVAVIASKRTVLGLDLRGGTELIYQASPTAQNPEVEAEDVDRAIEIIRERVDTLGVAEPEIARVGSEQITVALPDVQNAERAEAQVGKTAQLFLYDFEQNLIRPPGVEIPDEATPDQLAQAVRFSREFDAVEFASKRRPECFRDLCSANGPTYYLFDEDSLQLIAGPAGERADLFLDIAGAERKKGKVLAVPQGTTVVGEPQIDNLDTDEDESETIQGYYVLKDRPELTGDEIRNPEQNFSQFTNQPIVTFEFTDSGREAFAEVTERLAERGFNEAPLGATSPNDAGPYSMSFAVVLDRVIESRPIINYAENPTGIDGRTGAQIEGSFSIQEAQDLADILRIGALPIELQLISQSSVSAQLGEQALEEGLVAGVAGLIIVLLFLFAYYRFLGLVAGLGLLVYALFFLAMMKAIPVVLTLPGIAGLILTIGVAADSNIVIFERIKEEVRKGRSMLSAITQGYKHGIATIIDANVITLLTAFILFVLATAGVKGFAFTLGIGTIVSLFTAVLFTQAFLALLGRTRFMRSARFLGAGEQRLSWNFNFTGLSRYFFSMSGAILAIGAIAFATQQLNLGIDFESGSRVTASLEREASVDGVRSALSDASIPGAESAEVTEVEDPELGEHVFQINAKIDDPREATRIRPVLDQEFGLAQGGEGFEATTIGPTFGEQVARAAVIAIVFSLLVISIYVSIRFEAKYAIPVLIAMVHDILIAGGVYALVGREVTSGTVAAFLTILGYSMYDTVIVFDRIRENVPRMPRAAFSQIVNRSVNEVLTRSLITGLSTVFLLAMLLAFGGETLRDFAFAMMVGVASGTYSSIFIASPVLTAWKERELQYRTRRAQLQEVMGYVPTFPEENVVQRVEQPAPAGERKPAGVAQAVAPSPRAPAGALEEPESPPQPAPAPVDDEAPPESAPAAGARAQDPQRAERAERQRKRRQQQRRRRKHGKHR